jgi:hypothetical protein
MGCASSNLIPVSSMPLENNIAKHVFDKTNTQDQIDLIKSSWKQIEDKTEFGIQIMLRYFSNKSHD